MEDSANNESKPANYRHLLHAPKVDPKVREVIGGIECDVTDLSKPANYRHLLHAPKVDPKVRQVIGRIECDVTDLRHIMGPKAKAARAVG